MPTTYTPNLGLSKPGNGELSGAWGTVANTVFDMVDRSVSGVGAITLTGTTTTLTTNDGTLSDGNYKVLVLGGSPSGANTITIAPNDAQKVYMVFNNTAESAIFTQGSGASVTVPTGATAIVYADGAGSGAAVADLTSKFIYAGGTYDKLATFNGLAVTTGNFIVADGTTWAVKTPAEAVAALGITATAAELNTMDGVTATTAELNLLDGVTATTAELNILDGVTVNAAELNGVTSKAEDTDASVADSISLTGAASAWTFTLSTNDLIIKYGATNVAKLDTSGNLTVIGDVTAFGTVA